jgi:hypothetical protein
VDNGGTMADYWDEATYLLETLIMKAQGQDKDGMDLSFTAGSAKVESREGPSKFVAAMEGRNARPIDTVQTDMRSALGAIFADYIQNLQHSHSLVGKAAKKSKYLTLIILTDGIWAGLDNKSDVETVIVKFIKKLNDFSGTLEYRPVSIQFIQFGHDPDATDRLWRLDNELKYKGIPSV